MREATPRTATWRTCWAPPDGARAGTRRRRSCTGRLLAADPTDAVARNNLANIEFARGSFDAARRGTGPARRRGPRPEIAATSYYNLSLAHLQGFEYQAYNEAKSNADRLAPGLVADYDRWRYDSRRLCGGGPRPDPRAGPGKFAGSESGVAVRNVAAGPRPPSPPAGRRRLAREPFRRVAGVFALAAFLVGRWRGPKAFTLHCGRCGTAFCRHCHLGQVSGGLCSQCYHLFVVRDGVSGPARNRKMAEVQRADGRRERVFRVLSVLSPGAGQVYGGWTLRGAALLVAWYGVLALVVADGWCPSRKCRGACPRRGWALGAGLALVGVWLAANRFRPESDVELPARPAGPRRARAAQAAG